ncbi:hypothetical protein E2C01_063611 [Portunus trituberculatus]|uniref:Uncharacterized protein n=1 Tax=Portunus trituberculatus TaxID=210409 RepID=A0A5B7HKY7_PORTR|nr:hypothetical protein [Portunus trituberculatus]
MLFVHTPANTPHGTFTASHTKTLEDFKRQPDSRQDILVSKDYGDLLEPGVFGESVSIIDICSVGFDKENSPDLRNEAAICINLSAADRLFCQNYYDYSCNLSFIIPGNIPSLPTSLRILDTGANTPRCDHPRPPTPSPP